MDRCDIYIHFLQTAQVELQKSGLNIEKLDALLEIAYLNAVDGDLIEYNQNLIFSIQPMNMSLLYHANLCSDTKIDNNSNDDSQKTNILLHDERITLEWKESQIGNQELKPSDLTFVGLNTIIGKQETLKYQLIHRYRVLLLTVHIHLSHARLRLFKSSSKNIHPTVFQSSKLLNIMQSLIQELNSYISNRALEMNWRIFEEKIPKMNNIDELLSSHSQFLQSALTQSLLSLPESLQV